MFESIFSKMGILKEATEFYSKLYAESGVERVEFLSCNEDPMQSIEKNAAEIPSIINNKC